LPSIISNHNQSLTNLARAHFIVLRPVRVLSLSIDASLRSFSNRLQPTTERETRTEIEINSTINKVRRLFTLIYLTFFLHFCFVFSYFGPIFVLPFALLALELDL